MADQQQFSIYGENRSLFSDYFLRERLRDLDEWEQDISVPFEQALELYQQKKSVLPRLNEAQTENEFIQPILEQVLGFSYDVQKAEKKQGRINIPDYILFPDEEVLKTAQQKPEGDSSYYNDALTLSDAKYWERPLDSKSVSEKDRFTNNNPSFQIIKYLTVTGLEWGILTNGSRWRLYSTKARSRIDSYFEVDLKRILEEENKEQFRYFYQFFRRQAYQPDPQTGKHFVERVFEASTDYGSRLEKKLKDLIFDDIFLELSKGFVHYRSEEEDIEQETEESLQEVYQGTLRLLYRLLFILHAESRSLLPLDNKGYLQYSLMKLKKDIADRIDNNVPQVAQSFDVWNDLDSLFNIIDKGASEINIPRYNGGLFRRDHPNNQFLRDHKIADKYLVPALELLTRETESDESERKPFIDYKSLNVEQLGSIYEGLLEFHLRQGDNEDVEGKELYLENDKGERKATGSYYTPHYIVEYIIENTLGPVFDERAATFEDLINDWLPKYREFQDLHERIQEGDRSEQMHNKRKAVHTEVQTLGKRATEILLNLKICDPAMGSGHFLKEATDKLAEKIITLLAEYPTNPVTNLLEEVRNQILASLDAQDIEIDAEEHLKDTNLIKRMVMKRSIYGVDLNPMAVELAKLSLWLDSFTVGAPLSFLDHHLKVGNSLIGSTVKEVKRTLELDDDRQIEAFGGPFAGMLTATELMRDVSLSTDATFSEIKASIGTFNDYEKAVKPYKRLLDLWISRHFDNDKAIALLRQYPGKVIKEVKGEKSDLHDNYVPVLEEAERQAQDKKYFHWELEFPEVFVNLKQSRWLDNPGFDAVVGNPPYGSRFDKKGEDFIKNSFKYVEYRTESYVAFMEQTLNSLKDNGCVGMIVPDNWMYLDFTENLRFRFLKETNLNKIIALPSTVFPNATVDTCIYIAQRGRVPGSKTDVIPFAKNQALELIIEDKSFKRNQEYWTSSHSYIINPFLFPVEEEILDKAERKSDKLSELATIKYGLKAYQTGKGEPPQTKETLEKRPFTSSSKENIEFKPFYQGQHVGRYKLNWDEDNWIKWGEWLAEPRNENLFEGPRLLFRKVVGENLIGNYVEGIAYSNTLLYVIKFEEDIVSPKAILAILNSNLMGFVFRKKFAIREDDLFPQILLDDFAELPIISDKSTDKYEINRFVHLSDQNIEFDSFYDLLEKLTSRITDLYVKEKKLHGALDPFKFLNKGVAFKKFDEVFADAIKYGQRISNEIDIGIVHHNIEELHLRPDGSNWLLSAKLKHKDPKADWDEWIKEDGNIVRTTTDIYRFDLSEKEGRYWQQAFEVLDEFEHNSSGRIFPGGKTSTTHDKLVRSKVPVFDESANIEPLVELRQELAEVKEKIEKTDKLIDQVVYQLYGLSEEEVRIVEEGVR